MKNFNGRPFFSLFFYCAGQSENPELGARPPEYLVVAYEVDYTSRMRPPCPDLRSSSRLPLQVVGYPFEKL
jgi:hypothetical protein